MQIFITFFSFVIFFKIAFALTINLINFTVTPKDDNDLKQLKDLVDSGVLEFQAPTPNIGITASIISKKSLERVFGDYTFITQSDQHHFSPENPDKHYDVDTIIYCFQNSKKEAFRTINNNEFPKSRLLFDRKFSRKNKCLSSSEHGAPKTVLNTHNRMKLEKIGISVEKRDILMIRITQGKNSRKPIIMIVTNLEGGQFASRKFGVDIVNKLSSDDSLKNFTIEYEWLIILEPNPDGQVYASKNAEKILWDKNKNTNYSKVCPGVNLAFNFKGTTFARQNHNPCERYYGGPHPFSEPETKAIKRVIERERDRIKIFITVKTGHKYFTWFADPPSKYNEALAEFINLGIPSFQAVPIAYEMNNFFGNELSYIQNEMRIPHAFLLAVWPEEQPDEYDREFSQFESIILGLSQINLLKFDFNSCKLLENKNNHSCVYIRKLQNSQNPPESNNYK